MIIAVTIGSIAMGLRTATSLLFTSVGEILNQKAGNLNLGIEGFMLLGAVSAYGFAYLTENKWLGLLAAIVVCSFFGALLAFVIIKFRANQVAAGIAFTIFAIGLSSFVGRYLLGLVAPDVFRRIEPPFISDIPYIGRIFNQDILTWLAIALAIAAWYYLFRTRPGLHLRAVGDAPSTSDTLGINVFTVRYAYFIFGSAMAGLGGAYLSLAHSPGWIDNMAAGRGWITIALVFFATWNPMKAVLGALLFGIVNSVGFRLEATGIAVPSYFLRALPYLMAMFVLLFISMKLKEKLAVPKYLAIPYDRESR